MRKQDSSVQEARESSGRGWNIDKAEAGKNSLRYPVTKRWAGAEMHGLENLEDVMQSETNQSQKDKYSAIYVRYLKYSNS